MRTKNILSFLLSSLIILLIFAIMSFLANIVFLGLFDTTSNIQEYESQKLYETIIDLSIALVMFIGITLILGFEKKIRFWGVVITIIVVSGVQIFQYNKHVSVKQFEKHNWILTEKCKFIEARSIVLSKSFEGLNRKNIIKNLGNPNSSKSNQLSYEINDLYNWVLLIEFDSCCVINAELKKEPWNL